MAMPYLKAYKVPLWIVVDKSKNYQTVLEFAKESGAYSQEWPANSYAETLNSYKNKGWEEYLEEGKVLPPQLVMMSMKEHFTKTTHQLAEIVFVYPIGPVDRKISEKNPATYIFDNALLHSVEPIVLSQLFQIQELCYNPNGNNQKAFVSTGPVNINLLHRIANKIVTIGEGEQFTINTKDVKKQQLSEFLTEKFTELSNQI